jgi:hypothetical protein
MRANSYNLEIMMKLIFRNELVYQHSLQNQPQQMTASKNPHNLNLLQTAFAVDSSNASKVT